MQPATCLFPQGLLLIKSLLMLSVMEDLVFWVACLIMFRTLLRGSNVFFSDMCFMFENVVMYPYNDLYLQSKDQIIVLLAMQLPMDNMLILTINRPNAPYKSREGVLKIYTIQYCLFKAANVTG